MKNHTCYRNCLAGVMVFAAAVLISPAQQTGPAVVTQAWNSRTGGVALRPAARLHAGESVRTLADGGAIVRVGSAVLELEHRTVAHLVSDALALTQGYAYVRGTLPVQRDGVRVVPVSPDTGYEMVALPSGGTYLHVLQGKVRLMGIGRPAMVAAGRAVRWTQPGLTGSGPAGGISMAEIPVAAVRAAALGTGMITNPGPTDSAAPLANRADGEHDPERGHHHHSPIDPDPEPGTNH